MTDLAYSGGLGVDRHRGRLHFDDVGHLPDREVHVDPHDLIHAELDVGLFGGAEALMLRRHRVDPDGQ